MEPLAGMGITEGGYMSVRKMVTYSILLAIVIGVLWLAIVHKAETTEGSFQGLTIGETKADIFQILINREDVVSIHPEPVDRFVVSKSNLGLLGGLETSEVIIVDGLNYSWQIRVQNARVTSILKVTSYDIPINISEGDPIAQVLANIETSIVSGLIIKAYPSVLPHSDGLGGSFVNTSNDPSQRRRLEYEWLLQYDHWVFTQTDKRTRFNLFFENNSLVKIGFRNYFIELP